MKTPSEKTSPEPRIQGAKLWGLLVLNWLVPGGGFWACGRWARGTIQFLMVGITFALGLALHAGVAWPSWSMRDAEFSLLSNLTFIAQMGAGGPALVSLAASLLRWPVLGGMPEHYYYELGSYFLIVAGAINYYSICNLYDRIIRPTPRFEAQESATEAVDS